MKSLIIAAILFLDMTVCVSQTVMSSCAATPSVSNFWRKSADKLSVRRVTKIGDTYKDSVVLNKQISNNYLKALLAVYNATSLAARDTVMAAPIVLNQYYPHDLNYVSVGLDSNKIWTKNLRNDIIPCGNVGIDNLITKYHLKKVSYLSLLNTSLYHIVNFRTDSNCYIDKLCDKFNSLYLQGVGYCYPGNENRSDAFNITDSLNTNFTELTYSYGWGGCMIPCQYRRYWTFRVYNDCSVEYITSYGYPLPFNPFTSIGQTSNFTNSIQIYPNPVKDNFKISGLPTTHLSQIIITDRIGQTVYKSSQPNSEIDISHLKSGFYFLTVFDSENRRFSFKIIKD